MIRSDQLGVTSVIRDLALRADCYVPMLHFFRSNSWSLEALKKRWYEIVLRFAPLYRENGRVILVGDGVKQAKEGRFMPGVKKMFQESENASKPTYIFGHFFGGLAILMGGVSKWFCIPLFINLQDGLQPAADWEKSSVSASSHVVQMIENGYEAARTFGNAILLLDCYFLSVPALKTLDVLNGQDSVKMDLVTKAKKCCRAYEKPIPKKAGRGRPAMKGASVKVRDLFRQRRSEFQTAEITLYGKQEKVRYFCTNLLWGQQLYKELRFVLVEYGGVESILVTTDLTMDPLTAIGLYGHRFQIEATFRELKQQIGGFCYHFWTKAMPKQDRYRKEDMPHPLQAIQDDARRKRILATVRATEAYVLISCISMGVLQMLSLRFSSPYAMQQFRYLRTPAKAAVSEATVMCFLRKSIFLSFAQMPHCSITQIIREKQAVHQAFRA